MLIFGIILLVLCFLFVWMSCTEDFHENQMFAGIMSANDLNAVYDVIFKHRRKAINSGVATTIIGFIFGITIAYGILFFALMDEPTAMDVYRGKTELVIKTENTIKDSIIVSTPIDSIVVWKNN